MAMEYENDKSKRQKSEEILKASSAFEDKLNSYPYDLSLDFSLRFNDEELKNNEISFDQNEKELVEKFVHCQIALSKLKY